MKYFDSVTVGAIRTIIPVASEVGIYHEFGGSLKKPANYDFSKWTGDYPDSWTRVGDFQCFKNIYHVTGYTGIFGLPIFGDEALKPNLGIAHNTLPTNIVTAVESYHKLQSESLRLLKAPGDKFNITADFNATGRIGAEIMVVIKAYVPRVATYALSNDGTFINIEDKNASEKTLLRVRIGEEDSLEVGSINFSFSGLWDKSDMNDVWFSILIFGAHNEFTFFNKAELSFKKKGDQPKGNIYKTTQGENFTKKHDIETSIFGDYITSGLNGYFYDFPKDDASLHIKENGTLITKWTRSGETMPIGQHTARQMARMFSKAHDLLRCEIDTTSFDPLAIYRDCELNKYVIVNAEFDFLRSTANVEIEECVYDTAILKRDFIYSYFDKGESNIKSIGGIAGGGGGTGTSGVAGSSHTHPNKGVLDQISQANLDVLALLSIDNGKLKINADAYSTGEISAYGAGSGSGGGSSYNRLDAWADYTSDKSGWVLSALLGNDLNTRLSVLEAGGSGSYQPLDADLTSIAGLTGTSGFLKKTS